MEAKIMHALPQSCFLPGHILMLIRMEMLPKLKAVMSDDEVIAASDGQQPELDRMRAVTCCGCAEVRCPLNFKHRPSCGLDDLMDGQYADRIKRGDDLIARLLPEGLRVQLEYEGIKFFAFQTPSRKNPQFVFSFTRGEKKRSVECEIGKCRLRTDKGEETLLSFNQLHQKICDTINELR